MSLKALAARGFCVAAAGFAIHATGTSFVTPAFAAEGFTCPRPGCMYTEGNLCCSHADGSDTYYYYPKQEETE
jgi:hypothetical protein